MVKVRVSSCHPRYNTQHGGPSVDMSIDCDELSLIYTETRIVGFSLAWLYDVCEQYKVRQLYGLCVCCVHAANI
jgi:hypothetical protein